MVKTPVHDRTSNDLFSAALAVDRRLLRAVVMRALVLAAALGASGCVSAIPSTIPRGPSLAVTHASDWAHVSEPGWFSVDLPRTPAVLVVPDHTANGTFEYKKVASHSDRSMFTVGYVELDPREAESARRFIIDRYAGSPSAGLHLDPIHDVELGGASAQAVDGIADPDSALNDSHVAVAMRVRVLRRGGRLFQLQCSTPTQFAVEDCDRFLSSFRLE